MWLLVGHHKKQVLGRRARCLYRVGGKNIGNNSRTPIGFHGIYCASTGNGHLLP